LYDLRTGISLLTALAGTDDCDTVHYIHGSTTSSYYYYYYYYYSYHHHHSTTTPSPPE
jgi:hypothetical protein